MAVVLVLPSMNAETVTQPFIIAKQMKRLAHLSLNESLARGST